MSLKQIGWEYPPHWEEMTIEEVTSKVGSGATPRGGSSVYVHSGTPLIRSQNIYDHRFEYEGLAFVDDKAANQLKGVELKVSDVLINITGDSILRCCLLPEDLAGGGVNQHVSIVRSNGKVLPLYLQKWLSLDVMKDFMLGHSSGGTRKAITKGHILSFPLPVPPLDEQSKIVAVFRSIDEKISSNRRAMQLCYTLLDAFSVARAENLPTVPLSDIAVLSKARATPSKIDDELVDHYSLPAFDNERLPERVKPQSILSTKSLVSSPAVLVSRLNPRINRTWLVFPENGYKALASTEFAVLEAESKRDLASIWLAVRDPIFIEQTRDRVTGTSGSHQRIRPADLMSIEVPDFRQLVCHDKDQAASILEKAHQLAIESLRLSRLRDTLLPELLSGRIRTDQVRDCSYRSGKLMETVA